jgi:hypothetical protein
LPVVVAAALDDDVEGAVTDGVLGELGEVVEGDVDCAIALVNARPLTAATAMMFLSMFASCQAFCEREFGVASANRLPWGGNAGTGMVFPICDTVTPRFAMATHTPVV